MALPSRLVRLTSALMPRLAAPTPFASLTTFTSPFATRNFTSTPLSAFAHNPKGWVNHFPPPEPKPEEPAFHFHVNHTVEYETALAGDHGSQLAMLSTEKSPLIAGSAAGGKFCVLALGGSQHKVTVDDIIVSEKLTPVTKWCVGAELMLTDEVLLCGSSSETLIGVPSVPTAQVVVRVEEITRDATVLVFKKRRRKHSRRKNGHRRHVTFLRVLSIDY